MAYDEDAAQRLRAALGPVPGLTEKKRFGGGSLMGAAWSEPQLIRFAYAFEQATRVRRPPQLLPTVELLGEGTPTLAPHCVRRSAGANAEGQG